MAKNQVSADVEFQGLFTQVPGAGANNQSPFLQTADMFSDYMAAFTAPATSSTLSSSLPAATVYVLGQRVVIPDMAFTVGASATSYLDLSNTGVLTVSTSSTVTANSLRLWSVVSSSTAITGVARIAIDGRNQTTQIELGTTQDLASGSHTTILFATQTAGPSSTFDAATGAFVAPVAGTYLIISSVLLADVTSGVIGLPSGALGNISVASTNHGSVQGDQIQQAQSLGVVWVTRLDAGEQVTANVYQDGTTDTIGTSNNAGSNFLEVILL
jgi:hypothetical protein